MEAFECFDGCKRDAGEDVVKFLARWEASWSKCSQTGETAFLHLTKTKTKTKKKTKDKTKTKRRPGTNTG